MGLPRKPICLDTAAADHVPVVCPRAGDEWRTDDGLTLHFIGPSLPFIGGMNAINDNSITFVLCVWGGRAHGLGQP
jgi:hypothetical protein